MFKKYKKYFLIFTIGMAGGIFGNLVTSSTQLHASQSKDSKAAYEIYNSSSKRVGTYTMNGEQGTLFLFSDKGKMTVQLGSYPNGSERGQSLIGLSDPSEQLRMLFRLHSSDNSPTLIMKDRYGIDKIVIGLRGENQTPYFDYVVDDGRTINLLQ